MLLIDNYDSFTYNLVQYLGELGAEVDVCRNDERHRGRGRGAAADALVISPGPCTPNEAGISMDADPPLRRPRSPILGVCLGHQCIGQVFGGTVVRAPADHARQDRRSSHDGRGAAVRRRREPVRGATRYHSLVAIEPLPDALERDGARRPTARSWACATASAPVEGVQFHPESILTPDGTTLLAKLPGADAR